MALTDLTRISTSGIATGSTIDAPILRKDVSFHGSEVGVVSALFDSSDDALEFNDNVKLKLGDSGEFEIFHRGTDGVSLLNETGSAYLSLGSNGSKVEFYDMSNGRAMAEFFTGGACSFKHGATTRLETTSHGAVVTGILTATSFSGPTYNTSGIATFYDLRVSNNLTVEGTTTTLDTNLIGVDRVNIGADSNTDAAIVGIQSGTADLVQLYDGATQVVTVDDTGLVGINTTTPAYLLDVVDNAIDAEIRIRQLGTSSSADTILRHSIAGTTASNKIYFGDANDVNAGEIKYDHNDDSMQFTAGAIERLRINSTGVGIGTTNAKTKFNVYTYPNTDTGGILVQNANYSSNLDKAYLIAGTQTWTGAATDWSTYGFQHKLKSDNGGVPRLTIDGSAGGSSIKEIITFMTSGRVGIGQNNPATTLEIKSDAHAQTTATIPTLRITNDDGSASIDDITGSVEFFTEDSSDPNHISGFMRNFSETNAGVNFSLIFGTKSSDIAGDATEKLRIRSDGNVGIGTNNPQNLLHILGEDPQIKIQDSEGGSNAQIFLDGLNSNFNFDWVSSAQRNINLINSGSGTVRVGVGHTAPNTLLHLQGDTPKLRIESTNALADSAGTEEIGRIEFEATKASNRNVAASLRVRQDGTWSTVDDWFSPTAIEFYTQDQSGTEITKPRFIINSTGKIGIGTDAPATILDIVGDAPQLDVEATNDSSGFRINVKGQSTGELFRIQKDSTTKLQIDQSDLITFFSTLTFNGTELYPVSGIGSNVGHRLNYRRNPPQSRTNTGNAAQQYYKIGEIVLNGSESAEINIYGTQSYSAGTEVAGKVTIIMRATNGNTLAGFWYEETLGNVNLSDVRWKYSSGTTYELWVKASTYANIAPFVRCTGNGFTSFNEATGDGSPPAGSTAFSTYHRKNIGTINTIRYNPTDTTFHQNIKMDSGKGIDFSATSDVGSLGSELFNDYESGTYTPTLTTGSGGNVTSTTSGTLSYVKVGRLIHIQGRLHFSTSASDLTEFEISLPIANTSGDAYDTSSVQVVIRAAGGEPAGGIRNFRISGNSSQMRMQNEDGDAYGNFGVTNPHINVNVQYYCQ